MTDVTDKQKYLIDACLVAARELGFDLILIGPDSNGNIESITMGPPAKMDVYARRIPKRKKQTRLSPKLVS